MIAGQDLRSRSTGNIANNATCSPIGGADVCVVIAIADLGGAAELSHDAAAVARSGDHRCPIVAAANGHRGAGANETGRCLAAEDNATFNAKILDGSTTGLTEEAYGACRAFKNKEILDTMLSAFEGALEDPLTTCPTDGSKASACQVNVIH